MMKMESNKFVSNVHHEKPIANEYRSMVETFNFMKANWNVFAIMELIGRHLVIQRDTHHKMTRNIRKGI